MSESQSAQTFYRVVRTDLPTLNDFQSNEALGRPLRGPRPTAAEVASWKAVSTYVTEALARDRAQRNQELGRPLGLFIAKLVLPAGSPVLIAAVSRVGHCDLTGEAQILLDAVVSVVAV
jgi:hypothetical protein